VVSVPAVSALVVCLVAVSVLALSGRATPLVAESLVLRPLLLAQPNTRPVRSMTQARVPRSTKVKFVSHTIDIGDCHNVRFHGVIGSRLTRFDCDSDGGLGRGLGNSECDRMIHAAGGSPPAESPRNQAGLFRILK
jgi:hypothetical protein